MSYDFILVGGGLQNGLNALAILGRNPDARIAVVEQAHRLGGNHTWCFHADDVPEHAGDVIGPLVEHRWLGYEVRFPRLRRVLGSPYAGITSERFDRVVRDRLTRASGADLLLGSRAVNVHADRVELDDGRVLTGRAVIDARGPDAGDTYEGTGYQTFVGLELALSAPHGLEHPLLMDATVDQTNGFRFFYVLPLAADRVLVEETFFTDLPTIDEARASAEIGAYADDLGLQVGGVIRTERGVLPLPWSGPLPVPQSGPLVAGYRGGWFHPVTGYSLPAALRLALTVAEVGPDGLFGTALAELARNQRQQMRFGFRLNRMLFNWFAPETRYNVLERFYRLPEALIRRFYSLETTRGDRARIFVGRPPRGMSWRAVIGMGVA